MKPEEAEEELGLYDRFGKSTTLHLGGIRLIINCSSVPFAQRIETCIQRYKQRRRFDSDRKKVLDAYLTLGGVDCGPNMFQGTNDKDKREMDAKQIAKATATDFVEREKFVLYEPGQVGDAVGKWTVDFVLVAKGYL
jgi:Argonaute siRNA chaperone (ARC) complex subunit Arb1